MACPKLCLWRVGTAASGDALITVAVLARASPMGASLGGTVQQQWQRPEVAEESGEQASGSRRHCVPVQDGQEWQLP